MDAPAPAHSDRDPLDPFLAELLQNPRHRLTVLRMELDIQRFMQNPEQQQFEFQHLPTSYLRCAAHRVAQHYGLQTMAIESTVDGLGSKVIARKTSECKYPAICLSEVPAKLPEKEASEQVKIVIRPRPNKASSGDSDLGMKKGSLRTVEERKEEYDKARARIFSDHPEIEASSFVPSADGRTMFLTRDEQDYDRANQEIEKTQTRDGSSRVAAIFRDREKDRFDPDYDRNNARFVRGVSPGQNFGMQGCSVFQPPFMPYGAQYGHLPANQPSVSYNPSNPPMNMYCAFGANQNTKDAVYMQWPSPTMMYANSYEHFRHAVFQAPFYQPLSFEHTQNC